LGFGVKQELAKFSRFSMSILRLLVRRMGRAAIQL
jgi:hypothetical protein